MTGAKTMKYFSYHYFNKRNFWFRLFGYGLSVSDYPPMFSERRGFRKCIRINGIKFEVLKP